MNTITNTVLIELKESSIVKIMTAIKCLDDYGIFYTIIEDTPTITSHKMSVNDKALTSKKAMGSKGLNILDLLAKGRTYHEIADDMDISIDGVRYYVKKIFKTLGVKNGRDAVRIYITKMQHNIAN